MEEEADLYYGDLNEEVFKAPLMVESKIDESDLKEGGGKQQSPTSTTEISSLLPPITPIAMPFLHLYPIDNYTFGSKDSVMEIETSYHHRMAQLAETFRAEGTRRTVEAVLLTYENNHPHVLLLQLGETNIFKLPGDTIQSGEEEYSALPGKLSEKLSPTGSKCDWDIDSECLGVWYRPNFDNPVYPYVPAHVTRPKERITLFLVRLPPNQTFAVPRNVKIMAVPLCDLYENAARYGPIIAGLPHLLSKFNVICS